MTRFARVKSTHQRVEGDSTPWSEFKKNEDEGEEGPSKITKGKGIFRNTAKKSNDNKVEGGETNKDDNPGTSSSSSSSAGQGNSSSAKLNNKGFGFVSKFTRGEGAAKQVKIFGHFWVPEGDARRLQQVARKLKDQGVPRKVIFESLRNERRKAEKAARRQRDKTCFNCRQFGHVLAECPNRGGGGGEGEEGTGEAVDGAEICFKCGSTEHSSRHCKKRDDKFSFATCFICSKKGHLARQCPSNSNGIYPTGGCCDECGSVAHLKKDCPDLVGRYQDEEDAPIMGRLDNPFASTEYEEVAEVPSTSNKDNGMESMEIDEDVNQEIVPAKKGKNNKKRTNGNYDWGGGKQPEPEVKPKADEYVKPRPGPTPAKKRKIVKF